MPCQAISSWTFDGLVAAYLDLAIAYLLLCASTLVYLASKFLGLFGYSMPCPCNGVFSDPSKNICMQEILGSFPLELIFSVYSSVKCKVPFANSPKFASLAKGNRKGDCDSEFDGEDPCSLFLEKGYEDVGCNERDLRDEVDAYFNQLSSQIRKEGSLETEGSRLGVHRSLDNLRHQTTDTSDPKMFSSVSLHDQLQSGTRNYRRSPTNIAKTGNDSSDDKTVPVIFEEEGKALEDVVKHEVNSHDSQLNEHSCEIKPIERMSSPEVEINIASVLDSGFSCSGRDTIRLLEQALEEEQAACAALSLELEKERNSAATAADEAMAMILRVQGEKAMVEMEAKQFQRMVEAKSAFDTEEMNILKEILLRRETEKNFLEKEVEAYREMLFENEQSETDLLNVNASRKDELLYPNENLQQGSHQFDESPTEIKTLETLNEFAESAVTSYRGENCVLKFGKELAIPEFEDDADSMKLEEIHQNPADRYAACEESEGNITEYHDSMIKKQREGPSISDDYVHSSIHYVWVIGNEINMSNEVIGCKEHQLQKNVPSHYPRPCDVVSSGRQDYKFDRSRSVSDMAYRLPALSHPQGKISIPDMRRKSMSAFDFERLKIESEVGCLRGRLRVVQQSREKLSFSLEKREKDQTKLQHSWDMTSHPRETRKVTSAKRSLRQDSLPPLFSKVKVMSKKRRSRSAVQHLHSA